MFLKNNRMMKRLFALFFAIVIAFNINVAKPKAAGVSITIAVSSTTVNVGDTVNVTVNVKGDGLSAFTMSVGYNGSVLSYVSGSGAMCNGGGGNVLVSGSGPCSVNLTFKAIGEGKSGITTSGTEFLDIDSNDLAVTHAGVNIVVNRASSDDNNTTTEAPTTTEQDNRSANCNLKDLQISPGKLEPGFTPGTTSYFVQVEESCTKMVVSATPEDPKASTKVSGAGLIEPGENTVKITVTAENGATKVYRLRVVAGEDKGDATVTIGEDLYKFANNQNVDLVPEGFSEFKLQYKDWEVLAFKSPNGLFTVVCLIDDENNFKWFMYDETTEEFKPYKEYSSHFNRYLILPMPEEIALDGDFERVSLDIDGDSVDALKSEMLNDDALYLIYAMNIDGDTGFYVYDAKEKAFLRYVAPLIKEKIVYATPSNATPTEVVTPAPEPKPEFNVYLYVLIGVSILAFFLLVLLIVSVASNNAIKKKARDAEDMVESLSEGRGFDRSVVTGNSSNSDRVANSSKARNVSTYDLEQMKASEDSRIKPIPTGTIELPRNRKENRSFVDTMNETNSIINNEFNEKENTANDVNDIRIDTIPNVEFDIGYKPDAKERTFEQYVSESERINSKLKDDYDISQDSAFGDEGTFAEDSAFSDSAFANDEIDDKNK